MEEMLPMSTVDSPSLQSIIEKIHTESDVKLPQGKKSVGDLKREYALMEPDLGQTCLCRLCFYHS